MSPCTPWSQRVSMRFSAGFPRSWPGSRRRAGRVRRRQRPEDVLRDPWHIRPRQGPGCAAARRDLRDRNLIRASAGPAGTNPSGHRRGAARPWPDRRHRPAHVVQAMADDTLALLARLGIGQADLFGYSLGAGIALNLIANHPTVVRKAVLASVTYDKTGFHPEMFSGPESGESADAPGRDLQIPFEQEYRALAPDPGNWPVLLAKVQAMELPEINPQALSAIDVPILLIIGDSD